MTQPEPPPRFQIRITDIFVLLGLIAAGLGVWGFPQEPWFVVSMIALYVVSWLFVLSKSRKRLATSRYRIALLLFYVLVLSTPFNALLARSYVNNQEYLERRKFRIKYLMLGMGTELSKIQHQNKDNLLEFSPTLKDLNYFTPPPYIIAAECNDPTQPGHLSKPYNGYFFKILKGQGPGAPGGAKSYFKDGKMTEGFAILIYPSLYQPPNSLSYLIDMNQTQYEKDLGPNTNAIVSKMELFDPIGWEKVTYPAR